MVNKEDIIRMAEHAGFGMPVQVFQFRAEELERFARLVAAAEREACAKLCEEEQFELTEDVTGKDALQLFDSGCRSCAEMIRRKGET